MPFSESILKFCPILFDDCHVFKVFCLFNIHYTYNFLKHNMLWVLLLILKISVNVHLTSLQSILKKGYWKPGTPLRITLTLQCPILEGVRYMSANWYFNHHKIFWRPSPNLLYISPFEKSTVHSLDFLKKSEMHWKNKTFIVDFIEFILCSFYLLFFCLL